MSDSDDSKPKSGGSVPGAGSVGSPPGKPADGTTGGTTGSMTSGPASGSASGSTLESPDLEKPRTGAGSAGSDAPAKGAAAAPKATQKSGAAWSLVIALLLVVALGAAYIAWPFWAPALPDRVRAMIAPVMDIGRGTSDKAEDGALAALEERIAGVEKALAATRNTLDVARTETAANLAREIDRIETKITAASGDGASLAKRLGELEQRLAALAAESRTASTGAAAAAASTDGEALAGLAASGKQTSDKVAALEAANTDLRNLIVALTDRLAAMENRPAPVATGPGPANALMLAVGQLREAVRGTDSYAPAYDAVAALAGKDAGTDDALAKPLAALAAHKQGTADLAALRRQFEPVAGAIVRATVVPRGDGWIDRTLDRVASLVTIRKTGEKAAAADDVPGLVARAELRLAAGDLSGAVKALSALKGAPADAAADWLAAARARLAVDSAVDALMREALVRARS